MKTSSLSLEFKLEIVLILGLILIAWTLALLTSIIGHVHWLDYRTLVDTTAPIGLKLVLFLLSWQVMTVGLRLPSSLPLIQLFAKIAQKQNQNSFSTTLIVLVLGYLSVWTGFALLAFLFALALHFLFLAFALLNERPWLISSATLFFAGIFQFSELKEKCLKLCRHPVSFLHHHYQRGIKAAWRLGIYHGLYCLGCCWALMLVMFATRVGHITTMLLLGGVMMMEKTSLWGQKLVPIVGVGLMIWAIGTVIYYT